ncbi:SpoIID/LytB domain-containing protein [Rhodohalobacter sp. SW132]|uniref:SpoIID/LytB domain-containing protein n=1 Tax=Rhodohalobacter sp. SW132 TaxID=2293433 RepID=UPI001ADF195D|nr:SpoIID/LytB domain-containing protein [Rhodohalobacter sp. SW132]
MTIKHLFFLTLILPFLSGFTVSKQDHSADPESRSLQADRIVRVSLFSLNPPDSVRITSEASSIRFYSDQVSVELSDLSIDVAVKISENRLYLETSGIKQEIDSLMVISDDLPARLISEPHGYRYYHGRLLLKPGRDNRSIEIINSVPLESYIAAVVGSEMNFEHPEALKAQAVVSRTYALWSIAGSPYPDFDVRDYEANQVYLGHLPDRPRYEEATQQTRGEILTWSDQLILAVFSSTCGGHTSNNEDVWAGEPHPYLRALNDGGSCSASPHYEWSYTLHRDDMDELLRERYGFRYRSAELQKDQTERVSHLILKNGQGRELRFTGNEFRLMINATFGPMAIRSTRFSWVEEENDIIIEGSGMGHGVGMCQWGALGLAENGWNYKDILSFYFSGVKIVNLGDIESNQLPLYQ